MSVFFPEEEVCSVYDLPFESLAARGIRDTVFNADSTLVPPDAPADACCRALIQRLKTTGFRMYLISDSKAACILPSVTAVNPPYVERALKPRRYGYRRAMARMGTAPTEIIAIGDQLLTDIWRVNRAGIYSLLVQPMESHEEMQIRLKRLLECPVLTLYQRKKGTEE